jgi:apolipoprotein N-acyltransferase
MRDRLLGHPCLKPPYLAAILSGILIGTSYIPFPPWALFFMYLPLWFYLVRETSWSRVFWTSWTSQFVLTLIGFNWVSHTVNEFGHIPLPLSIGVLLLFCSLAHLHIPLAALAWFFFCRRFKLHTWAQVALLPVFFSVSERIYPMIFQWHHGYTWLWGGFPAFQLADIVGFSGLSTINFAFNALLLMALIRYKAGQKWLALGLLGPVAFIAMNVAGHFHGQAFPKPDKKTSVMLIQANIGNQEKLAAEAGGAYRQIVIDRFVNQTLEGIKQEGVPEFIVWPETAFPEVILDPTLASGFAYRLRQAIEGFGTRLITGGYSVKEGTQLFTNSFFVIGKNGAWLDKPYHKSVLLAFGEYIPFGDTFPVFYQWLPYTGHFGRGPGPSVLNGDGLKIGAQICYEGLFDWFTRDLGNKGAQVIVNVTNDSWYGTWQEPYQHLYMTLARAVEVRRPLIRSTNTGISGVILAGGEILPLSPMEQEWHKLYEVPYLENPPTTLFMSWGYWLFPALFALTVLLTLTRGRTR